MDLSTDPALERLRLRAEEYRARARDGFAAAEDATLDRVREQREASAAVWADLADAEEARLVTRQAAHRSDAESSETERPDDQGSGDEA